MNFTFDDTDKVFKRCNGKSNQRTARQLVYEYGNHWDAGPQYFIGQDEIFMKSVELLKLMRHFRSVVEDKLSESMI